MNTPQSTEPTNKEPGFPGVSTAQLAMYVGLGSLTVFFGASLVAYFITQAQSQSWRQVDLPHLPYGLWVSTGVLVLLSCAMRRAERHLAQNRLAELVRWLQITLGLSVLFLGLQGLNWREVALMTLGSHAKSLYTFTFYMLTALHAVHVLFGMGPHLYILRQAKASLYSPSNSEGVRLIRQYWDFLLVVWVVLLAALWLS